MAFGLGAGACFYYVTLDDASPTPLVQRPHRAARGELRRADRGGAGAAHLRAGRRRRLGGGARGGRRRQPGRCCSPTSTTSTTTATRPTSRATPSSSPATTRRSRYLSDTGFEELQTTAAGEPRPGPPQQPPRLPARRPHVHRRRRESRRERCARRSRRRSSAPRRRWSSPSSASFSGLGAVERLAEEAGSWPEAAEDWQWCARFGYQVIERRGTGGGAFRLMYSRFLEEAGRAEAPLAAEAAARWTELAGAFHAASESDEPEPGALARDRRRGARASSRPRSGSGPRWPQLARPSRLADSGRGRHDPAGRRGGSRRRCGRAAGGDARRTRAGRAAGVERLDGGSLRGAVGPRQNLLLRSGVLGLHSHLGMSGSGRSTRAAALRKPARSAWAVLATERGERSSSAARPCACCRRAAAARPRSPALAPTSSPRTSTSASGRAISARRRPARPRRRPPRPDTWSPASATSSRARPASPPTWTPGNGSPISPAEQLRHVAQAAHDQEFRCRRHVASCAQSATTLPAAIYRSR